MEPIRYLGTNDTTGAYMLWIKVLQDIGVKFGRYQQGQVVEVAAGNYIYVGSAMAAKGSMTLARRLLRHTSRSDPQNPHGIQAELLRTIHIWELAPGTIQAPTGKKLHWNIDYLLEENNADLSGIIIIRSPIILESRLAKFLSAQEPVNVLAPGLGAHDHPGQTHILHVRAGQEWWVQLPERVVEQFPSLGN